MNETDIQLAPCNVCHEKPKLRHLENGDYEILHQCGITTVSVIYWLGERVVDAWNKHARG